MTSRRRPWMLALALALPGAGCDPIKATVGASADAGAMDHGEVAACTPVAEVCNGRDDDCDGVVDQGGVCRDGAPDVADAGLPLDATPGCHSDADCASGFTCAANVCQRTTVCAPGTADCNRDAADGCETNLALDRNNCGACGMVCSGAATCASGACVATDACAPVTEVCNGVDDNCDGMIDEALGATTCGVGACARTVNNCVGGATVACAPGAPVAEVCNGRDDDCDGAVDDGVCTDAGTVCAPGTGDCDANALNGCEVNLASDAHNCGACGVSCAAGRACSAGACL